MRVKNYMCYEEALRVTCKRFGSLETHICYTFKYLVKVTNRPRMMQEKETWLPVIFGFVVIGDCMREKP